jgi:hypothetical protein
MLTVIQFVKRNSWNIMESKSSLPHSQKPNTDPCPEQSTLCHAISLRSRLILFSHIRLDLPTKILYALLLHALPNSPSYYSLSLSLSRSSQYSHQHPILKHPQVVFCPLSDYSEKRPAHCNVKTEAAPLSVNIPHNTHPIIMFMCDAYLRCRTPCTFHTVTGREFAAYPSPVSNQCPPCRGQTAASLDPPCSASNTMTSLDAAKRLSTRTHIFSEDVQLYYLK